MPDITGSGRRRASTPLTGTGSSSANAIATGCDDPLTSGELRMNSEGVYGISGDHKGRRVHRTNVPRVFPRAR